MSDTIDIRHYHGMPFLFLLEGCANAHNPVDPGAVAFHAISLQRNFHLPFHMFCHNAISPRTDSGRWLCGEHHSLRTTHDRPNPLGPILPPKSLLLLGPLPFTLGFFMAQKGYSQTAIDKRSGLESETESDCREKRLQHRHASIKPYIAVNAAFKSRRIFLQG